MSRYLRYAVTVFILAIMIGAVQSTPAKAGQTVHPDGLDQICLCFGRLFNGFNATGTQPNGQCARFQVGPFCFVDTELMPLFWKERVKVQTGDPYCDPIYVGESGEGEYGCYAYCPPGKMVLSCNGWVEMDRCYYTNSKVYPHSSGTKCVHDIKIYRMEYESCQEITGKGFNAKTWAICASPGMPSPP